MFLPLTMCSWYYAAFALLLTAGFAILSMGPYLRIMGNQTAVRLPYLLLYKIFPPFRITGVPVRFDVMVRLCLGITAASGVSSEHPGTLNASQQQPGSRRIGHPGNGAGHTNGFERTMHYHPR